MNVCERVCVCDKVCVCVCYPPVVLSLEKLELLLDAVQRFWDGELKGLAGSLVGRLKQTHARTRARTQDY